MRNGLLRTLFLLLLCQGASAAETVYVHDQLRLGVRAAPSSAEKSIAVVTTGDPLVVLGEQDSFMNIRTESGLEGWVSKSYVSTEPPARTQLKSLQQVHQTLQQQHDALQQQLNESRQQAEQKAQQLEQLSRDNAGLQQRLASYTSTTPGFYEKYRWPMFIALLLCCFGAGWYVGVRWKARRVAERIGGLEI